MSRYMKILLSVVVILFIASCGSSGPKVAQQSPKHRISKIGNPVVASDIYGMPKDASRVVLGICSKILNSNKKSRDMVFQSSYRSELRDSRYFSFQNAVLLSYEGGSAFGEKNIEADIFFKDSIGRIAIYRVFADYSVALKRIIVHDFRVEKRYTNAKNSICFIVPAKKFDGIGRTDIVKSFYRFYSYIASNAVTPEEASRYRGKRDWLIVVFVLDRVSDTALLNIGVADSKDAKLQVFTDSTKYMDFDGWRAGLIMAKFYLLEPNSKTHLLVKTIFAHGKEQRGSLLFRKSKLVSAYEIM